MRRTLILIVALLIPMPAWAVVADCSLTGIGLEPTNYVRSEAATAEGMAAAATIVPLDVNGVPSTTGLTGMIGIGMSNAKDSQSKFYSIINADSRKNPRFRFIRAAQDGKTAAEWADVNNVAWANSLTWTAATGVTPQQVQAAMVTMTQRYPQTYGPMTETQLRAIEANLLVYYPNVKRVVFTDINYTGYSGLSSQAPEPYVHNDGFTIMAAVLAGGWLRSVDFLDWWANGITPNPTTGLSYICPTDYQSDGLHLALTTGATKVGTWLRDTFYADPTTHGWMWR